MHFCTLEAEKTRLLEVVVWPPCIKGAFLYTRSGSSRLLAVVNLVAVYKRCTFVHFFDVLKFLFVSKVELSSPFRLNAGEFN